MTTIDNIIELIGAGHNTVAIADKLGVTRQSVDFSLRVYAKKNHVLAFDGDFIFKMVTDNPENRLRLRITSMICKDKYVFNNIIIDKRFKPKNQFNQLSDLLNETIAEEIPVELDVLLEKLHLDKKYKEELKEIFFHFYPQIIIFDDYVISSRKAKIMKLVKMAAPMCTSMEEMYGKLCKEKSTLRILEDENISSFEELNATLKLKPLDENLFIKTCYATWELKNRAKDIVNEKEILEYCESITKEYPCGFHIEVLMEQVLEKFNEKISPIDFRVMLIESKKYRPYKASIIIQASCSKIQKNVDILKEILTNGELGMNKIIAELRRRGRALNENSIRALFTEISKANNLTHNITRKDSSRASKWGIKK